MQGFFLQELQFPCHWTFSGIWTYCDNTEKSSPGNRGCQVDSSVFFIFYFIIVQRRSVSARVLLSGFFFFLAFIFPDMRKNRLDLVIYESQMCFPSKMIVHLFYEKSEAWMNMNLSSL